MQSDEFLLPVEIVPLEEGGYLATSKALPGLVVQGRTQANARILIEVYLAEKLPLPPLLRRALKRKTRAVSVALPITLPVAA